MTASGLCCGDVSLARKLKRGKVGDSDDVSASGGVKDDVKGVEETVVGENLVFLLGVVGSVKDLDLSLKLTGLGVEKNLNLINSGVKVNRVHGTSLDVTSLSHIDEPVTDTRVRGLGVTRSRIEREVLGTLVGNVVAAGLFLVPMMVCTGRTIPSSE